MAKSASSTSTTFDFVLKDGTATADDYGTATFSNGVSYDAATGKITVPAGVTSFTVTVPTINDTVDEADETLKLAVGGKDATGTIVDNDDAPTITVGLEVFVQEVIAAITTEPWPTSPRSCPAP